MVMLGDISFNSSELLHQENLCIDGKQDKKLEISVDLIQVKISYFT